MNLKQHRIDLHCWKSPRIAEGTFSVNTAVFFFVCWSIIKYWIEARTGRVTFSSFQDSKRKVLDPHYLRSSPSKKLNFHFKRQTDLPPSRIALLSHSFSPLLSSCVHRVVPPAWTKDDYTNLSPRKSRHFISSQTKSQ